MMTAPQDDAPTGTRGVSHPIPGTAVDPSSGSSSWTAAFAPRWGRVGIALVGLLALAATLVTLVLGAFGVVSLLVPLMTLAVAAAAVAALRMLATRSRRARVDRAFLDAMAPVRTAEPLAPPAPTAPAAPRRPTALFDAEETPARRLTAMEMRTAALAVAHGSTVLDVRSAPAPDAAVIAPHGSPEWAPVQLPRPTYVDAAKAERQAPAPLDLPEAPKPVSRTPIKTSEAAARIAASEETVRDTLHETAAPATGRINLDDVLQRRRA